MPNCEGAMSPAGVVLLQAEDRLAATVRAGLLAAKADINKIVVYDKRRFVESPLIVDADLALIANAIADVQAKLVVFDPFAAFVGGNANNDQSIRKSLAPLIALWPLARRGCARAVTVQG